MEAQDKTLPFLTAASYLDDRYGITMEQDRFIELAYPIWRDIGNIAPRVKDLIVYVPEDLVVELPDDCEFVDSVVTSAFKTRADIANNQSRIKYSPQGKISEEEPIAGAVNPESNARVSEHYNYGESVEYSLKGNNLIVKSPYLEGYPISIKYSTINKDDMGLPLINDKEIEAIAATMAYREMQKRVFQGEKQDVKLLKEEADIAMAAATIPTKINDDELDKLLEVTHTWDRKTYGNRFNLIK